MDGVLSVWDEPAAANPPRRVWRDWVLVAALVTAAVLEGLLRPDVVWRPVALVLAVGLALTLLWRRTHPLAVIVVVFSAITAVDVVAPQTDANPFGLYSMAYVLLLPYALARWASGRAIVVGLAVTVGAHILRETVQHDVGDLLVGIPFLLAPALLGLAVRYRSTARTREVDQFRMREREQLARELHDTVAHHVSAIAIQAQAGRVLADARPEAAVDALRVIEAEASLALSEMRAIVGALRDGATAEVAPQRGVADVGRLARPGDSPRVDVEVCGNVTALPPAVDAALYRLAQEAVTNAVRHARHATRVDVRVEGDDRAVHLHVEDDGEPVASGRVTWGYGLVGMSERATLLGGTLTAEPGPDRGWVVTATIPRVKEGP